MRAIFLTAVLTLAGLLLWPGGGPHAEQSITAFRCEGPFGRDASHASLVKTYGTENVVRKSVDLLGDAMVMTVVFPKDPRRWLAVGWRDEKARNGLDHVIIRTPSWSVGGITIGMSPAAVERINGKPFKLGSFEGDGGGVVTDWQGGRLATLPGGCLLRPGFRIDAAAADAVNLEADAHGMLTSSGKTLRAAGLVLGELQVSFPKGDGGR